MPIQKITSGVIESSQTLTTPTISGNLSLDSTGTSGVRLPSANTLTFHTAGTEDVRITSAGNVGIGVTTPSHKLAIGYSNADSSNKIAIGNISGYQGLFDYNNGNEIFTIENTTDYSIGGINFKVNGADRGFFDINGNFKFNSGYGSVATAYGCRAWVHFDGSGTPTIRAGGNVSSITDNGEGDYTINFTNAMPDRNYAVAGAAKFAGDGTTAVRYVGISSGAGFASVMTTTSVRVVVSYANGFLQDPDVATVTIHR